MENEEKKIYTYEEAIQSSIEYFDGEELPAKVFLDKYALRDNDGNLMEDTPDKMHRRLAIEFARIEKKYPNPMMEDEIFDLMDRFKYIIPQGSPMSSIGNPYHIQSSGNCFTIKPPFDSYGGIFYTDQQLGQLMKRRCVEENTVVNIKNKGNIFIKDTEVGDLILSYNIEKNITEYRKVEEKFYNNVDKNDRIIIKFSNGTILKTSKKHPLLSFSEEGYNYVNGGFLNKKDVCIKPPKNITSLNYDKDLSDIAWYIGCHIGDGSVGKTKNGIRIRNVGDNEGVIKKYAEITNKLTNSNACYKKSKRKEYKTDCWEYCCNKKSIYKVVEKYFDGMIGKKVYSAIVPSFIKKNNLFVPFIAGLVDSDGYIRDYGTIDIALCAKNVIDDISSFLSTYGFSYSVFVRNPKRQNEKTIYRIQIHSNREILDLFEKNMCHDKKKQKIKKSICREFSHKKFISKTEKEEILKKYGDILYPTNRYSENKLTTIEILSRNNLSSIVSLLKKNKNIGIGALNCFLEYNLISQEKYDEICQRIFVEEIKDDTESNNYVDLKVEKNNNFYAGNFGLVNVHNCGVGLSLSNLRPKGVAVKNAARTTDGIAVFMERFSNTCREVAQNGRRGAEIQLLNIHHPEIKTFITIKKDRKKVTGANISIQITDDFMNAVKNDEEFELKWPVDSDVPVISEKVSAKEIWDLFIKSSWESSEPGVLFWDTVLENSASNCYGKIDPNFYDTACNPCLTGDTLVYVADGRGNVPIKTLAQEEKDVLVFCYDDFGDIVVRKMRNPRVTGFAQKIYKITFDDGNSVRATENHKFRLSDGDYRELKDLNIGDSIKTLIRYEAPLPHKIKQSFSKNKYYWLCDAFSRNKAEHRIIAEYYINRRLFKNEIVHHKNYDGLNNSWDNLNVLNKKNHDQLHRNDRLGLGNPYHKMSDEWKHNFSSHPAESNHKYSGFTHDAIIEKAVELTKRIGRRFSYQEWLDFADSEKLPKSFSQWRKNSLGSICNLAIVASKICGFANSECSVKNAITLQKAYDDGYDAYLKNDKVFVKRVCECCGNTYENIYKRREISFCSQRCAIKSHFVKRAETVKDKQLSIYTKLKFYLNREPLLKEWKYECNKNDVVCDFRSQNGFDSYEELKIGAEVYNHRIVSIEYCGDADVYNGTVDDFHNFFIGGFEGETKTGKKKFIYINSRNCGEIVMGFDSCRLLSINLYSFVENKFLSKSYFDFDKFSSYVQKAQKIMDDIVDLEIELIERILKKINSDPEPIYIKKIEKDTWTEILNTCKAGRRTGLGITGLADTLAALGIRYGDDKSIKVTEEIYKVMVINAYKSSCIMAKERGSFPIFSFDIEKESKFINKILNEDVELKKIYNKYGRRNVALTTTAPTGSVSIEAQVSSGIEPVFSLKNIRRKKIHEGDKNTKIDFIDDMGDKWQEFIVYHKAFTDWKKNTGKTEIEESPYYLATSQDVDWEASVDIQAAAQRWVCHSISKTCNLPRDVTKELVEKVYFRAWEKKCKGFTIYRDGSRTGVLIDTTKQKDQKYRIQKTKAPKRPQILPSDIYHTISKGQEYFVIVGILGEEPYEVFAGKELNIKKSIKKGMIKKVKRGLYCLLEENGELILEDISTTIGEDQEAITRLISASLRHGCDVSFVVHQLEKVKGDMMSFAKAVSRVLKKYITEGIKIHGEECPECGGELKRQEGCVICSCGYSRCG